MKKVILAMSVIFGASVFGFTQTERCYKAGDKFYQQEGECGYQKRICCGPDAGGSYWWGSWNSECEDYSNKCFNGGSLENKPDEDKVYTENSVPQDLKGFPVGGDHQFILPITYKLTDCICTQKGWQCNKKYHAGVLQASAWLHVSVSNGGSKQSDKSACSLSSNEMVNIASGYAKQNGAPGFYDLSYEEAVKLCKREAGARGIGVGDNFSFSCGYMHNNEGNCPFRWKGNKMDCGYYMNCRVDFYDPLVSNME